MDMDRDMSLWEDFHGFGIALMLGMNEINELGTGREMPVTADEFDKDRCVADHNTCRRSCELYQNVPISSLKEITLPELKLGERHYERILYGQFCTQPYKNRSVNTALEYASGTPHRPRVNRQLAVQPHKISSVDTVLEDSNGRGIRVRIYNVLSSLTSVHEIEMRFPSRMRVAIKEPFFKECVDGKTALRVDDPDDICFDLIGEGDKSSPVSTDAGSTPDDIWFDHIGQDDKSSPVSTDVGRTTGKLNARTSGKSNTITVEELEAIRSEGNRLFSENNWVGAVNSYSKCIDQAIRKFEEKDAKNEPYQDAFNRVLTFAYSNRAEARLRLQAYEGALSDADKALEFDSKHVKTLVRKGKAAHGLGLYEKSCKSFNAALAESPQEQSTVESIKASLKATKIAYEQSRTGNYNLSGYYTGGATPFCADFVGPVEIRRVHYGSGRRGLFATRRVEEGQILLVSNPLAIVRQKSDLHVAPSRGRCNHLKLIRELTTRVSTTASKRQLAQLCSLLDSRANREMEIPSMELFRPGSEWFPQEAGKLPIDKDRMGEIIKLNSFGSNDSSVINLNNAVECENWKAVQPEEVFCGIWTLPSFMNHSCVPNCLSESVGDAILIRPVRDIEKGEEVTIPYFEDSCRAMDVRGALTTKHWCFSCQCDRCSLERTLMPHLSKISDGFSRVIEAASADMARLASAPYGKRCQDGRKWRAAKELAAVASTVEDVMHSNKVEPKKQDWIRALFIEAYIARYHLSNEKPGKTVAARAVADILNSVSDPIAATQWKMFHTEAIVDNFNRDARVLGMPRVGLCVAAMGRP